MENIDHFVELKEKIEQGKDTVSLGYVVGTFTSMKSFLESYGEYEEDSDSEEDSSKEEKNAEEVSLEAINTLLHDMVKDDKEPALFRKFDIPMDNPMHIAFGETMINIDDALTVDKVKPLCEKAWYGDLATHQTKMDDTVRNAFTFQGARLLIEGQEAAMNEGILEQARLFFDHDVALIPHAFNLYEVGGHFQDHVDTQRHDTMIGTVVFIFSPFMKGGELSVGGKWVSSKPISSKPTSTKMQMFGVAFHATTKHCVHKVEKGVRYSISYDVCMKQKRILTESKTMTLFHKIQDAMDQGGLSKIGILLQHRYSPKQLSEECILGNFDNAMVLDELPPGMTRTVIPMLWHLTLGWGYETHEADTVNTNEVYTLDKTAEESNLPFFCAFETKDMKITELYTKDATAAFTGNDADDGESDRIYATYAVIFSRVESQEKKRKVEDEVEPPVKKRKVEEE